MERFTLKFDSANCDKLCKFLSNAGKTARGVDPLPPPPPPVEIGLRLRGIMIGRHFHVNTKVPTVTCKDNNNSKSRAATCVKFDISIK